MKLGFAKVSTREQVTDEGKKRDISAAFAWIEETFAEAKLQSHSKNKQQIALTNKRQISSNKNTKKASHEKVSCAENVHWLHVVVQPMSILALAAHH